METNFDKPLEQKVTETTQTLSSLLSPESAYYGRITTTDWTNYTLSVDISQKNYIFLIAGAWQNDEVSHFLPISEFKARNSTGSYVAFKNVSVAYTSNTQTVYVCYRNGTTISVKCDNSAELYLKILVI